MILHKQLLLLFVHEIGVVLDLGHAHQLSNLGLVGIITTVTVFFFDLIQFITLLSPSAVAHSELCRWSEV